MAKKKRFTKRRQARVVQEENTFLGFKLNIDRVNCLYTWPDMVKIEKYDTLRVGGRYN